MPARQSNEITRVSPWSYHPMFDPKLGQLLDNLWSATTAADFIPDAELTETESEYVVEVDVPGVDRKDITIDVEGRRVSITGTRTQKERIGVLRRTTRTIGSFAYELALPAAVDEKKVAATLSDGVLRIELPKARNARGTRITVD